MNDLRESLRSLGVDDPETAVAVHAVAGAETALGTPELPQHFEQVAPWLREHFLRPDGAYFESAATAPARTLGEEPGDAVHAVLGLATVRPRTRHDLRTGSRVSEADLDALLPVLEAAGLLRPDPNPLEPDNPFWTMNDRLARFHYAVLRQDLPRWRRGYITDQLWRRNRARFERYVARAEFLQTARAWALGVPDAASTTRIVVPDPYFRQMRTLEVAAWNEKGGLVALGTVRWRFRMVERQLKRLRYVRRLLGDPPVRLYCVASRFDEGITGDEDPDLTLVSAARLLAPDNEPQTPPQGDLAPISRLVGPERRQVG